MNLRSRRRWVVSFTAPCPACGGMKEWETREVGGAVEYRIRCGCRNR